MVIAEGEPLGEGLPFRLSAGTGMMISMNAHRRRAETA